MNGLTDEEREVLAQVQRIADHVMTVCVSHGQPRYGRYLVMRGTVAALGRQFAEAIRDDPERAPAFCRDMLHHLGTFLTDVDRDLDFVLGATPKTRH